MEVSRLLAKLTLRDAAKWNDREVADVAAWLREQAEDLSIQHKTYARRFEATYELVLAARKENVE